MKFPHLFENSKTRVTTRVFKGYDLTGGGDDDRFVEMTNMSGDAYPAISTRRERGLVDTVTNPQAIASKDALIVIANGKVYINDYEVTGLHLTQGAKKTVSMGAYLLIFPDKIYLNTADLTDFGSIENSYTSPAGVSVSVSPCDEAGGEMPAPTVSVSAPGDPENGDYWLDTSGSPVLKLWSESNALWTAVDSTFMRIEAPGIDAGFDVSDGVTVTLDDLTAMKTIVALGDGFIVTQGLLSGEETYGSVTVSRTCPDMDVVCSCQNRVWGAKYGVSGGVSVNEIYACALGDFKKWNTFLGISTDSWTASVGSDGAFTGAVSYQGSPFFFKEDCIHRVTVSPTGAHRVSEYACRGVESGSGGSIAVVNEVLFYKSRNDFCAFDGANPVSVSRALGDRRFKNAVAGALRGKYYVSAQDGAGNYTMLVYDSERGLWHVEDGTHAVGFCEHGGDLYYLTASGEVIAVTGSAGTLEGAFGWSVQTGEMSFLSDGHKYVSRYLITVDASPGSVIEAAVSTDGGAWETRGTYVSERRRTLLIPVRPRRCERCALRISGRGQATVRAVSRDVESGSEK